MDPERIYETSERLRTHDLDWEHARSVGLTDREVRILTYFADIEAQTAVYLRDLMGSRLGMDSDLLGFLAVWNYEEHFHGRALTRILGECGIHLEQDRTRLVRDSASLREVVEALLVRVGASAFGDHFHPVYMAWGATQELTTLRGYEQIQRLTRNRTLAELCARIAKQERRHFAWYFHRAATFLARSSFSRQLTRWALDCFWSPVGAGVKSDAEVATLIADLFPGEQLNILASEVESRMRRLPGLESVALRKRYLRWASAPGASTNTVGPPLVASPLCVEGSESAGTPA